MNALLFLARICSRRRRKLHYCFRGCKFCLHDFGWIELLPPHIKFIAVKSNVLLFGRQIGFQQIFVVKLNPRFARSIQSGRIAGPYLKDALALCINIQIARTNSKM